MSARASVGRRGAGRVECQAQEDREMEVGGMSARVERLERVLVKEESDQGEGRQLSALTHWAINVDPEPALRTKAEIRQR